MEITLSELKIWFMYEKECKTTYSNISFLEYIKEAIKLGFKIL